MIKGRPIDEIKLKGNNPHVNYPDMKTTIEAANPLPLTSKLIWISDSHTGDYHDNKNGNMFMKWIMTKVIPLADRNYPVVKMVPMMENALYHHVRGIPSLTSFSNKTTVNLMKEHGINYLNLPLTDERISLLPGNYNNNINNGHLRIPFNEEKSQKRKTK